MAEKNVEQLKTQEAGTRDNLETVELAPPTLQPALTFQQDEEEDSGSESGYNPSSDVQGQESGVKQPHGTHLRSRQTRTLSETTSNIRDWSVQRLKVTRQVLSERFGRGLKTVDPDLDDRLNRIRDMQTKYGHLISLTGHLQLHFQQVVDTQQSLAEHFAFLSVRCPELHTEFVYNSDAQKKMAKNGTALLDSMKFFISNLHTLSAKVIDDTLITAKNYESARVLYDAYRHDLENVEKASANSQAAASRLPTVKEEYEKHKKHFEQLRKDLDIKLKLLDENRLKVMQKQLVLLNSAFAAYYSGNHAALDTMLKEFNTKLQENGTTNDPPSWLEELSTAND